jgi:hypothetical protein
MLRKRNAGKAWPVRLHRVYLRPGQLEALGRAQRLELPQRALIRPDLVRLQAALQAVGGQQARRLADVPLHRVQPVTAVGDVGDAQVLAGRQEVAHAHRQEGAQGDAEGQGVDVDVVVVGGGGVQVDPVATDADAVEEGLPSPAAPRAMPRAVAPTCCSVTVKTALIRRLSRM